MQLQRAPKEVFNDFSYLVAFKMTLDPLSFVEIHSQNSFCGHTMWPWLSLPCTLLGGAPADTVFHKLPSSQESQLSEMYQSTLLARPLLRAKVCVGPCLCLLCPPFTGTESHMACPRSSWLLLLGYILTPFYNLYFTIRF